MPQDVWKPISENDDWKPIPASEIPITELSGIKFRADQPVPVPESKGIWQGLKDVPEEIYHHVSTAGKSSLKHIQEGNYPAAFHDIAAPIADPFTELMKGGINAIQGKPPIPQPEDPTERKWAGVNQVAGAVGLPQQAFREAWESKDYPRLAGQGIGAVAGLAIPHYIGKKLGNIDISVESGDGAPPYAPTDIPTASAADAPLGPRPQHTPPPPSMHQDLYDLGYSQSEINVLTPDVAQSIITNQTPHQGGGNTPFAERMKQRKSQADALRNQRNQPPPPTQEVGAPSQMEVREFSEGTPSAEELAILRQEGWTSAGISENGYPRMVRNGTPQELGPPAPSTTPTPQTGEAIPYIEGQDIPWNGPVNNEVIENFRADGYGLVRERGKNIFRRFMEGESGEFDPQELWRNIKRYSQYFRGEPDANNVDDWRQALIRAGAAGDEEATNIIAAHVRELEQQASSREPIDAVDVVHEPPIVDDAGEIDWQPIEDPWDTATPHQPSAESQAFTQGDVIDVPSSEQSLLTGEPESIDPNRNSMLDIAEIDSINDVVVARQLRDNWIARGNTDPSSHNLSMASRAANRVLDLNTSTRTPYRGTTDRIRQQMNDLEIPSDKEQWYRSLNDESLEFPEEGNQPTQDILGLHEMNRLGEIEGARIPEFDPNFAPKEYNYPEAEHLWEPKLKLREPLGFTHADIDQLEIDLRNAPSNSLGAEYGRTGIEHGHVGKPGIEIRKYGDRTSAYWRDKTGHVTAIARGDNNGIDSLTGKKIKPDVDRRTGKVPKLEPGETPSSGIGGARGNFEVLKALVKAGIPMRINSSLSPYSRGMIETFIKQARRLLSEEQGAVPISDIFGASKDAWEILKKHSGIGMGESGGTKLKSSPEAEAAAGIKEHESNFFKEAVVALPTSATTIDDLSAPGRQGLSQILTPQFWKAVVKMYPGGLTVKNFDRIDAEVRSLPLFQPQRDPNSGKLMPSKGERMGIKLIAPGHKVGPREEATASRWIETGGSIPYISAAYRNTLGIPARMSNRAFATFNNVLRANRAQYLMDHARSMSQSALSTGRAPMPGVLGGMKLPDMFGGGQLGFSKDYTPQQALDLDPYHNEVFAKEIADFVNTATGRGPLKTHILPHRQAEVSLEGAADKLGYALFSPRNFAAKVRMMNPSTYIMSSPMVRKEYLKAMLSTGAAWYAFAEMSKLADPNVDVNMDPTNADFGKIRIGDFRMDPAGGFQQFLVLYSRLAAGGTTSSSSNKFRKFGSGPTSETAGSTIQRFGANKLNPVSRFAYDFAFASKRQPFQVMDRAMQMYLPLVAQDAYEIYKEDPDLFPWLIPIAHGWGSQIYDKKVEEGRFFNRKNDFTITGGGPMDWMGK